MAKPRTKDKQPDQAPPPKTESKPKPAGYTFGRPTKYDKKFCDIVVEFMGQGRTNEGVAAELGVHPTTLREWRKDHEEFNEAFTEGELRRNNLITDKLIKLVEGGNGNVGIFLAMNWTNMRDKRDINHSGSVMTDPGLAAFVKEYDEDPIKAAAKLASLGQEIVGRELPKNP